ncbi:hypothetical protein SADUNF_Sadunf17G0079300 [Salix dunnii]|uniref:Uncharacterized protein n=1 Tax=Salix dunnii TaxID=1413687 RepID=A0A835JAD7_9ROSI|nr:hypothetical protein SADUNF_Sadunf17G0079300 [Salix dunnii]
MHYCPLQFDGESGGGSKVFEIDDGKAISLGWQDRLKATDLHLYLPQSGARAHKRKKPGEEERKIQVLTVLRNGAILKNIFVTIEKASPTSSEPSIEKEENIQETEEILSCGRHPDCNIHYPIPPSNQLKTISQKLFATDLSSDFSGLSVFLMLQIGFELFLMGFLFLVLSMGHGFHGRRYQGFA